LQHHEGAAKPFIYFAEGGRCTRQIGGTDRVTYPASIKHFLSTGIVALMPQCDYARCVFLIGHMRCGSTALSNVLCSRPDISGYGETHVPYKDNAGPGTLVLNQIRQKIWKPQAKHLFDKLLHNELDGYPPDDFFRARAIFVTRSPTTTIPSIVNLFQKIGSPQFSTIEEAGAYYMERLLHMKTLWNRFPKERRHAVTYENLTQTPDEILKGISDFLALAAPLRNHYAENKMNGVKGAGDPLNAQKHSHIVSGGLASEYAADILPENKAVIERAEALLQETRSCFQPLQAS